MANVGNWTILGDNPVAEALRDAARFVDAPAPIAIVTEPIEIPDGAFAIGPTILVSSVEKVVPYYAAFEAIEEMSRVLRDGEVGQIYGCFTSVRIARGHSGDVVSHNALLPAIAITLDLLTGDVERVHTSCMSLLDRDDAWFVTLRFTDETIATVEAMAVLDPEAGLSREMLIEVTASERVIRAEPMRQSVVVESLGAAGAAHAWWEDLDERFLKLVAQRSTQPHVDAGSRIRAVWSAIQQSAESGQPVAL